MAISPTPPAATGVNRAVLADDAIAGHRRAGHRHAGHRRLWSVQVQLLAPVLVAMVGLGLLGTAQTAAAVSNASDARRAKIVATTATATVRLTHELDRELAETVALRQRGGRTGEQLVIAQRSRADQALQRYRGELAEAVRYAPALDAQFRAADLQLNQLAAARLAADSGSRSGGQTDRVFHDVTDALLVVAGALPSQVHDQRLASAARQVAAVAAVEHYGALERDLLRTVFSSGSIRSDELIALARLDAAREQREAEFVRVATAAARTRYDDTVTGPDIQKADALRNAVLSGDPAAVNSDTDGWYVAQSSTIRKVNLVGLSLSDDLDRLATDVTRSATRRAWLTVLGACGVGLIAIGAAVALAVRTSRRLRRLRAAALTVSRQELPNAIATVMAGASPDHSIGLGSAAAATRRIAASQDEVGELADAFSSVHRTALRLASDQAGLHLDVARMAETFARRIRTLITRQLRLLDDFERDETDPEALSRLFALDHLAARLRRNGENLLVLAGGEPGRSVTTAFELDAVITAAASEIEDFHRVEVQSLDAAVAAPVVGDLVHLLAELLENAASFSPPDSPVRVDARYTIDGIVLGVHDSGIGLSDTRLAEVNARLARRTAMLSSAAAGTIGLYVVARLATRHGIKVQLHSTATGSVAYVLLPHAAVGPVTALTASRSGLPVSARTESALTGTGGTGSRSRHIGTPARALWFPPYQNPAGVTAVAGVPRAGSRAVAPASHNEPAGTLPFAAIEFLAPSPMAEPANSDGALPRRNPGRFTTPAPAVPAHRPAAPIDPEVVRARLSALAEGVSAALSRSDHHQRGQRNAARDR
ncbi:MAG TPA: nitrate- and nitrite sensing domain-containing protein [Actinoplanes sp.]|nr:nitrate- and nitrite sensing domain-containing protein [Actinoplanes sp.]